MAKFAAGKFSIRSLLFECVVLHGGYFRKGEKGEKLKLPSLGKFRSRKFSSGKTAEKYRLVCVIAVNGAGTVSRNASYC